jgi:branched-chain amino acid transport system substrate-binding protein
MKLLVSRALFGRLVLTAALLLICGPSPARAGTSGGDRHTLKVGALLSLTGEWSTLGLTSKAALEIGVARINRELAAVGSGDRVKLFVADTKLDPSRALSKLKKLAAKGIRTFIGPQSSAEVAALKPYAERHGLLLISQGSTAGALAVANDNAFRFCPSDGPEGEAISALMRADGIEAVVPLWRADAGNQGLAASVRSHFTDAGGTVSEGVEYATDTTDFGNVVDWAHNQVTTAVQNVGAEKVAVFLAAFDEFIALFNAAKNDATLAGVKWYGSDGVVQNPAILSDAAAAQFAIQVSFSAPSFGLPEEAREIWEPLAGRVQAQSGIVPDAFSLAAYDALWVAHLADQSAHHTARIGLRRSTLMRTADRYFGATGWTALNDAGDRRTGNYDFYGLQVSGETFEWVRVAQYSGGAVSR